MKVQTNGSQQYIITIIITSDELYIEEYVSKFQTFDPQNRLRSSDPKLSYSHMFYEQVSVFVHLSVQNY